MPLAIEEACKYYTIIPAFSSEVSIMKNLGYYNGKYDEMENMMIPMYDRACFFGDAIYEATCSRNGKIFAIDDHVNRFFSSASLLEITPPCTKEELKALLYEMLAKMDTGENFIYIQLSRAGTPVRNHVFPEGNLKGNLWLNIYHKDMADIYKKVKLITGEDTRFFHCNIKTINLIPAVIGSQRAKEAGCDEMILRRNGRVTECAHSNVHIIKDGAFITAPTDNLILPGIARKHLIEACGRLGIPVREEPYMLDTLMDADEVLISSSTRLVAAAETVDGIPVGGRAPDLLRSLQEAVWQEFITETK